MQRFRRGGRRLPQVVGFLPTLMTWLHEVDDPLVIVWVNQVCRESECETRVRQQVQEMMMAEVVVEDRAGSAPGPNNTVEIKPWLGVSICKPNGVVSKIKLFGCRPLGQVAAVEL